MIGDLEISIVRDSTTVPQGAMVDSFRDRDEAVEQTAMMNGHEGHDRYYLQTMQMGGVPINSYHILGN